MATRRLRPLREAGMWVALMGCGSGPPAEVPPPRARADAQLARLREALAQPGTWSGPTGSFEVTPEGTLRQARDDCQYQLVDATHADPAQPTGCRPAQGELRLIGVEEHYVVLQETEPRMPLYAPAWLEADGTLHLGAFFSNRVWSGSVDDAGGGVLPWTPMHRLVVRPGPFLPPGPAGPSCSWEDDLAHLKADVPCSGTEDGPITRIRFTVTDSGGRTTERGALLVGADGVLLHPDLEVVTFRRDGTP